MNTQDPEQALYESGLLGIAIIAAQRVEFFLYGLASHLAHTPAGQAEKRFRALTPETFLRGDVDALKATLGQLVEAFGDALLIHSPDLVAFYKDRNRIAHEYVRLYGSAIRGTKDQGDGTAFLRDFITRAVHWEKVLRGALAELVMASARQEGRLAEIVHTAQDLECIALYHDQAARHPGAKATPP